jgi:LemA protein
MRKFCRTTMGAFAAIAVALSLSGCGYNDLQRQDEQVKSAWSEVLNQYQRRADLVPNLVNTVKGYAAQEQQVLTDVTNARASVGSIKATPELINDPQAFAKFQAAQGQLQSALSRLLVVAENYPNLKSDQNFRDLQAQLEGTENRIAVARNRYIKSVQEYNVTVRSFPSNLTAMLFKMDAKPNFAVDNEKAVSVPPTVDFSKQPAAPAPAPAKN